MTTISDATPSFAAHRAFKTKAFGGGPGHLFLHRRSLVRGQQPVFNLAAG